MSAQRVASRSRSLRAARPMTPGELVLRDDQLLELAELVAERLAERLMGDDPPGALIDAAEVARRYGKSRAWAYDHAIELGAIRIGRQLRFDPKVVERALLAKNPEEANRAPVAPARARRRPEDTRTASGAPLLEVKS